jgi:hypothetical protein
MQASRKRLSNRTGVMAIKKFVRPQNHLLTLFRGMTAVWDAKGNRLPVTILQISRAQVVSVKTQPKHGYWAVQVGIGIRSPRNVTKAMLGHFAAAGVAPKAKVGEFRVRDETGLLPMGILLSIHIAKSDRGRDYSYAFYGGAICRYPRHWVGILKYCI